MIQSSETSALLRVYIQRRQSTRSLGGWHSFRARQPRRAHIIFADMCTRLFSRRRLLAPLSVNRSSPPVELVGRPCLSADDLRQAAGQQPSASRPSTVKKYRRHRRSLTRGGACPTSISIIGKEWQVFRLFFPLSSLSNRNQFCCQPSPILLPGSWYPTIEEMEYRLGYML